MSGDFNKIITTEAYAALLAYITDLFKDMAKGFDPALALGTANFPTYALRWNSVSKYWEKFNGSTWDAMSADYAINITGSASKWETGRTITLTGDVSAVSSAWDGSGNLSFAVTLATVTAANGGTGNSSYTIGDLLYASGAATLSKLADVATGNALLSGGVGAAPSWGKVGLTTHITGTLSISNGGTGGTTAGEARTNLGLVIGTDVMGMGGGTFTGTIAATNLSGTNTGDEVAATTAVAGVIELATNAEVQAGTDATRAVTPASMNACTATTTRRGVMETATDTEAKAMAGATVALTPSNLAAMQYESAEQAMPTGVSTITVSHGLGAVPNFTELVFRCKTAEGGYSVGDEMVWQSAFAYFYTYNTQCWNLFKNSTQVGVAFGVASIAGFNKSTGAAFTLTAANWKVVLRAGLI